MSDLGKVKVTPINDFPAYKNMEKKEYYAITATVTFEKTVLVPVNLVEDIDQAIDLVDSGVGDASIMLLDEDGDFETKKSPYADSSGIYKLTDYEAARYQIIKGEKDNGNL